jgi:hypothetical protein
MWSVNCSLHAPVVDALHFSRRWLGVYHLLE